MEILSHIKEATLNFIPDASFEIPEPLGIIIDSEPLGRSRPPTWKVKRAKWRKCLKCEEFIFKPYPGLCPRCVEENSRFDPIVEGLPAYPFLLEDI